MESVMNSHLADNIIKYSDARNINEWYNADKYVNGHYESSTCYLRVARGVYKPNPNRLM